MSFLLGSISGAVAAGGVYYGFSNLIASRTEQHRKDLRALVVRIDRVETLINAPTPAASRIPDRHLSSMMKSKWNDQVESLFESVLTFDRRVLDWGKRRLLFVDSSGAECR